MGGPEFGSGESESPGSESDTVADKFNYKEKIRGMGGHDSKGKQI